MPLSYWEHKTWLANIDFAVIGSGIVGLSCALELRKNHPTKKIVIFEKGMLPAGASTKNAGFACFGSMSEILDDLESHSEQEVLNLVTDRAHGLDLLRETLGDQALGFKQYGGYELFTDSQTEMFDACCERLPEVNNLLDSVFRRPIFSKRPDAFGFNGCKNMLLFNAFEGQIDTGKMMQGLLNKVRQANIIIINGACVENLQDTANGVNFTLNETIQCSARAMLVATNGFSKQLLEVKLEPARAQVLITKPIKDLRIKGTFHLDKGYYYFRNIDDRILFGGGRNLDFKAEKTTKQGLTDLIQNKLEEVLTHTILPDLDVHIERRWSGIMGIGSKKRPIVKQISDHIYCGVRLGGMGVAIGSNTGRQLANLI
ncbi:MAG: FAD-dependent oxidoreductase [Gilvibacter sp.]